VCGSVTVCKPLSSKPGLLLPAEAGPNNHPVPNGMSWGSGRGGGTGRGSQAATDHAAAPAVPAAAARRKCLRPSVVGRLRPVHPGTSLTAKAPFRRAQTSFCLIAADPGGRL